MPANYIVINSKFKPFSYAEMLQPVQMATTAHQVIENEYADLATKANVWDEMANEQTDPYAYKMYKTYSNDLEEQAGQLAREGLTPASRQNMLKMKQRYSSDIVPIEQAYKRRQELIAEQRKLSAQDNTLMFDRNAAELSLDDLIRNPQLTYQSYSGATLAKQVGTAAQNLSKEMRDNPRKWRSILGNQYYETIMQKGYRPEEILQVLQNDPNASSILKGIVEDAVGSSNIANWGSQDTLDRAYDYARQGLWNAIGDTQYQVQSNKAYDYAMQERLANIRKSSTKGTEDISVSLPYRMVPKTTVEGDKKTIQMNDDLKFIQEVMKDPSILNETKKGYNIGHTTQYGTIVGGNSYELRPNMERLNQLSRRYGFDIKVNNNNGNISTNLSELAQKLSNDIRSSAIRSFSYKPNITQSDLISQVIKENTRSYNRRSGNTGIWELKNNEKGKEVKIGDLNSYFTSDNDIDFDPDLGFIINATDNEGNTKSAIIDTELLDDPNRTFSKAQQAIKYALDNGEDETVSLYIDALMNAFYQRFNTLEKRQSNTFSK